MDKQIEMNTAIMRLFLWSGVVVVVALIIAQGLIMGFVPGPSPNLGAEELAQIFVERRDSILLGCLIQCICWTFYGTWAIPIIMFIRRAEGNTMPALTYASLVNVGGGWVFFILIPMTWAVMAFRAGSIAPETMQLMNDWVWFDWLYTWPSFSVWMFIIAAAIFFDKNAQPVFPRWLAFFNIWCGILIFPAGMIGFFKTGPFAYDGLISFWFAVFVFFGWMVGMTVMSFRAVAEQERRQTGAAGAHPGAGARAGAL